MSAEIAEPVPVWELSDDGWDAVSGLDGDWLKSLPIGTRLYYIGPTTQSTEPK